MSLYHTAHPERIQAYRERTQRLGNMLNVLVTPAREKCVRCERMRTKATGRETKKGFVCHGCGRGK